MEIRKSDSIGKLVAAMAKARLQFKEISCDATNPDFLSEYSTLANNISATKDALANEGVVVMQIPSIPRMGWVEVTTMLCCEDEYLSFSFVLPVEYWDAQGIGAIITYARRYSRDSALDLSVKKEDLDGRDARDPDPDGRKRRKAKPCSECDGSGVSKSTQLPCHVCANVPLRRGPQPQPPAKQLKLAVGSSNGPFAPPDDDRGGYSL